MNADGNNLDNNYDDVLDEYDELEEDEYDELEEKLGRGGFEKLNKIESVGKLNGKKKIKPRQLVEAEIY